MGNSESWMNNPPAFENPEEALEATRVLKRPGGVPRDPQEVSEVPSTASEQLLPSPNNLDRDWLWVAPGLLYTIVGLDKSIFQLFSHALNTGIPVRTYQSQEHVFKFGNPIVDANPWFSIVQGIPLDKEAEFVGFVESFLFRRQTAKGVLEFTVACRRSRIADPFRQSIPKEGVDVILLLPQVVGGNEVIIRNPAGLLLETPVLSIQKRTETR